MAGTDRGSTLALGIGGAAGAVARVALAETWGATSGGWPWATFAVNLAGSFLLGVVVGSPALRGGAPRLLLGTGLCGALTTFSTLQVEVVGLSRSAPTLAVGYVVASAVGGLLLLVAGERLAAHRPARV